MGFPSSRDYIEDLSADWEIPPLRKPTTSPQRSGKKKRRLASVGMTGLGVGGGVKDVDGFASDRREVPRLRKATTSPPPG